MAPSRSPERAPERAEPLAELERRALAGVARGALVAAVERLGFRVPDLTAWPRLVAPGASFVTLQLEGELRGCIGTIEPRRALVEDVAANAAAAALEDPRFDRVEPEELAGLEIELSVLSPIVPLEAGSRAELLGRLRPGIDGLVLADGFHRATFLPAVWEQLPEPADFLAHLEHKAGLPVGGWSPTIRCARYEVESIPAGRVAGPG